MNSQRPSKITFSYNGSLRSSSVDIPRTSRTSREPAIRPRRSSCRKLEVVSNTCCSREVIRCLQNTSKDLRSAITEIHTLKNQVRYLQQSLWEKNHRERSQINQQQTILTNNYLNELHHHDMHAPPIQKFLAPICAKNFHCKYQLGWSKYSTIPEESVATEESVFRQPRKSKVGAKMVVQNIANSKSSGEQINNSNTDSIWGLLTNAFTKQQKGAEINPEELTNNQ